MDMFRDFKFANLGSRVELTALSVGALPLLKSALNKSDETLFEISEEGSIKIETGATNTKSKYHDFMLSKGGKLIYNLLDDVSPMSLYIWKDSVIEFVFSGNYLIVRGFSHNESLLKEIKEFVVNNTAVTEKTGHIYAIMRHGMQLSLSSLGNAGIPLVENNYTPSVMEDYKFAVRDLQSTHPSGRIVIMEGKPGTGKTHLIRAMLMSVSDAMFVLISPEIVTTLSGPELLPLLISYKNGLKGPIVLILEDADRCLVTRGADNINSIQSLLNLGDGILGSMLDLRIVATTNASKLEMEAAILRPGRLSKRLEVGALDFSTANLVFKRLLPDAKLPEILTNNHGKFEMTLAEVYALARTHGWKPQVRDMSLSDDDDDDYID